jgi:hypothetical protein
MKIRAAIEFSRALFCIKRKAKSINRLVEIRRRKIGDETLCGSGRKAMTFVGGNKSTNISIRICSLSSVFFKSDSAKSIALLVLEF